MTKCRLSFSKNTRKAIFPRHVACTNALLQFRVRDGSSYRRRLVTWRWGLLHIQCSKLYKGMEYTVLPMVLCTINMIKNSFEVRVGHFPSVAILTQCAESDVKQYSLQLWLCRFVTNLFSVYKQTL